MCLRAFREKVWCNSWSFIRIETLLAIRLGFCGGTRNPVFPSFMTKYCPPTLVATTGMPEAWASARTRPKDSDREVETRISVAA